MNKNKIPIIVAVISIIFIIVGIILVTKINVNEKTSIASSIRKEDLNIVEDDNFAEGDKHQYDIGRGHTTEENDSADNNIIKNETDYERYLRESNKDTLEEMSEFFTDATNKIAIYVNEEPITEREIAYEDFHLNNDYIKNYSTINNTKEDRDAIRSIIQKKVICQEAEKLGLSVSEEQIKEIKEVPNYREDIKKMAESVNMNYNEYEDLYIKSQRQFFLEAKWREYVIPKLHTGEISIDTKEFHNKYLECQKYIEDSNFKQYMDSASELLELYKQYLFNQANIEYLK